MTVIRKTTNTPTMSTALEPILRYVLHHDDDDACHVFSMFVGVPASEFDFGSDNASTFSSDSGSEDDP